MPAHGYEFYLLPFNSISRSFAALTREILSWTREDRIHIHKRACNTLLLYKHQWKRRNLLCNDNSDLFTCEDNVLFSRVKIGSFHMKAHLVFHWCLYNKGKYNLYSWRNCKNIQILFFVSDTYFVSAPQPFL